MITFRRLSIFGNIPRYNIKPLKTIREFSKLTNDRGLNETLLDMKLTEKEKLEDIELLERLRKLEHDENELLERQRRLEHDKNEFLEHQRKKAFDSLKHMLTDDFPSNEELKSALDLSELIYACSKEKCGISADNATESWLEIKPLGLQNRLSAITSMNEALKNAIDDFNDTKPVAISVFPSGFGKTYFGECFFRKVNEGISNPEDWKFRSSCYIYVCAFGNESVEDGVKNVIAEVFNMRMKTDFSLFDFPLHGKSLIELGEILRYMLDTFNMQRSLIHVDEFQQMLPNDGDEAWNDFQRLLNCCIARVGQAKSLFYFSGRGDNVINFGVGTPAGFSNSFYKIPVSLLNEEDVRKMVERSSKLDLKGKTLEEAAKTIYQKSNGHPRSVGNFLSMKSSIDDLQELLRCDYKSEFHAFNSKNGDALVELTDNCVYEDEKIKALRNGKFGERKFSPEAIFNYLGVRFHVDDEYLVIEDKRNYIKLVYGYFPDCFRHLSFMLLGLKDEIPDKMEIHFEIIVANMIRNWFTEKATTFAEACQFFTGTTVADCSLHVSEKLILGPKVISNGKKSLYNPLNMTINGKYIRLHNLDGKSEYPTIGASHMKNYLSELERFLQNNDKMNIKLNNLILFAPSSSSANLTIVDRKHKVLIHFQVKLYVAHEINYRMIREEYGKCERTDPKGWTSHIFIVGSRWNMNIEFEEESPVKEYDFDFDKKVILINFGHPLAHLLLPNIPQSRLDLVFFKKSYI